LVKYLGAAAPFLDIFVLAWIILWWNASKVRRNLAGEGQPISWLPSQLGQNEGYFLVMVSTTAVFLRRWASFTDMNRPVSASLPT